MKLIVMLFIASMLSGNALAQVKEFIEPRTNGLRMDRCLNWGKQCNQTAANEWCLQNGFNEAIHWKIDHNIAKQQPTRMLNSQKICASKSCDGFKVIVCYES